MTTILKAANSSGSTFLLPSIMTSNAVSAVATDDQGRSILASSLPLSGYADVARAATSSEGKIVEVAQDIEKQRLANQIEFERRIKIAEDEARAEGLEEGRSRAFAEGQAEWRDKIDRASKLLLSLDEQYQNFSSIIEDELVALVFAGVTRIVGTVPIASVQEVVRQAIVDDKGRITVRVAVDDLELLSLAFNDAATRDIEIVADPRVELGGCLVESDRGTLDARLETQVSNVRKALLAARSHSSTR